MKKTLLILLPIVALLSSGCEEKVIDIDTSLTQKVPVAMARVEADSTVTVRLTFSRFFLDMHPFAEIDNATVSLTVNGTPSSAAVTRLGGNYSIAYSPQPGDRLGLRVLVPGYEPLTAETTVPSAPNVGTAHVSQGTDSQGASHFNIRFRLTDNAATQDYYSIRLRSIDTVIHTYNLNVYSDSIVRDTSVRDQYISFTCNDVLLTDNTDINLELGLDGSTPMVWLPFSDELISGTTHDITISISNDTTAFVDAGGGENGAYVDTYQYTIPKLFLEVTSYSYDRYLYELTVGSYDDNMLSAMFTEPVQIHTNVQGGIGIFAACNRVVQQLQMNE